MSPSADGGEERRRQGQPDPVRLALRDERFERRAGRRRRPVRRAERAEHVDEPAIPGRRASGHLAEPAATDDRPAFDDPVAVDGDELVVHVRRAARVVRDDPDPLADPPAGIGGAGRQLDDAVLLGRPDDREIRVAAGGRPQVPQP